jgi:putative regulator of septum formation/uncharacterized protein DUF4190
MTQPPNGAPPEWTPPGESAPGYPADPPPGSSSDQPPGAPGFAAPPPGGPPAWGPNASTGPRSTNGYAIAALIFGIIGGILLSVIFGIVALVKIRKTGDKGRGLAIAGLVLSAVWLVGSVAVGIAIGLSEVRDEIVNAGEARSPSDSSPRLFPRPGECFNVPADETSANVSIVSCGGPHDAQAILAVKLPDGSWPGDATVERQAFAACERQMQTTYHLRTTPENTESYVLVPRRLGWFAGDRTVTCAFTTANGGKLTGPIVMRDSGRREWSDLAAGDCVNDVKNLRTVTVVPCTSTHAAQVTHTFTLPNGVWPGQSAVVAKSEQGCTARQDAYFSKHPSRVPLDQWHVYPTEDTWALGDREVVCYVTGANERPLKRSVIGN